MQRLTGLFILLLSSSLVAQVYQTAGPPLTDRKPPSTLSVDRGTVVQGSLESLLSRDDNVLQVGELAGTDPLRVAVSFREVGHFTHVIFFGRCEGTPTHEFHMEIFNVGHSAWDPLYPEITSDNDSRWHLLGIGDHTSDYVSNGVVMLRFRHISSGIKSHNLIVDYVALGS